MATGVRDSPLTTGIYHQFHWLCVCMTALSALRWYH